MVTSLNEQDDDAVLHSAHYTQAKQNTRQDKCDESEYDDEYFVFRISHFAFRISHDRMKSQNVLFSFVLFCFVLFCSFIA